MKLFMRCGIIIFLKKWRQHKKHLNARLTERLCFFWPSWSNVKLNFLQILEIPVFPVPMVLTSIWRVWTSKLGLLRLPHNCLNYWFLYFLLFYFLLFSFFFLSFILILSRGPGPGPVFSHFENFLNFCLAFVLLSLLSGLFLIDKMQWKVKHMFGIGPDLDLGIDIGSCSCLFCFSSYPKCGTLVFRRLYILTSHWPTPPNTPQNTVPQHKTKKLNTTEHNNTC